MRPLHTATGAAPLVWPLVAGLFSFSAGPVGLVVQRYLVESLTPPVIVAVQMTIGMALLWSVRLVLPPVRLPPHVYVKGLALGFFQPGVLMMVLTLAGSQLDSVTFVLITALFPGMVALFGRVLLKENLNLWVVIGLCISFVGMAVVVLARDATGANQTMGFLLAGLALIIGPSGIVAGRVLTTQTQMPWHMLAPLQITGAWLAACLVVAITSSGLGSSGLNAAALADLQTVQWAAFAYLGLIMTALSYMTFNYALSRLPVVHIGLLAAAGPATGTLAAALIFQQQLSLLALCGIAIVLLGAALPAIRALSAS